MIKPLVKIIFYYLLSTAPLFGQSPFHIHYDTNDGLPSSESYQVHCASDGRIWCATDRGIAVYNGYEFTSYTTNNGLSNNTNFKIYEDRKGRIWFTGLNRSISYYEDGQFAEAWFQDSLRKSLTKQFIHTPLEDEEGRLIFFGYNRNLSNSKYVRINPENKNIEDLNYDQLIREYSSLQGPEVELAIIKNEAIPRSEKTIFSFTFIKKAEFWIGIAGSDIIELNGQGVITKRFDLENPIETAFVDSRQQLWVATHKGLYHFENGDILEPPKIYLPNSLISDVTEDFEHNIWFSTHEGGLNFFPNFKMGVVENSEDVPPEARILSATALQQHIYFGTSRDQILAVDKDKNMTIVCGDGVRNRQMAHAHKIGNTIHHRYYTIEENEKGEYSWSNSKIGGNISLELKSGYAISGHGQGFMLLTPNGEKRYSMDFSKPFAKRVECMEEDRNGNIWLGTQAGIVKVDHENYYSFEKVFPGVVSLAGRITSIKNDLRDDNLWISTMGNGLVYKTRDSIYQILAEDGLLSNLINCIFVQDEHTVWVGTNQGLNQLSFDWVGDQFNINSIQQYGIHDGLPSNFINAIEFWDGNIWIATNEGVSYINPRDLRKNYPIIPIKLEQLTINGEPHSIDQESLKLKNDENTIGIKLMAITYLKKANADFYRYRLVGSDEQKEWTYTNDRNIQFVDLLPGNYTFEAAARNKMNQWSNPALNFTFQIKPHFLQTSWFKILALLLALLLFLLIFKYRERQLEKSNTLEQGLLKANMQAKEHELSALRNQMNPHFVFNSLNAIQSFIFNNKGERANYYLSIFSRLMRDSLKFSRLKYISLQEEIDFLKSYLELEQMRFPGKIEYVIEIAETIPIKHYAVPALLFQPILENAVKHAFKDIDYKGMLHIKMSEASSGEMLNVTIEDNGCGYAGNFFINREVTDKNHQSFGLTIVKNRIDLINAGNEDYHIDFKMINLEDIDPVKTGVRAEFQIPIMSILQFEEKS